MVKNNEALKFMRASCLTKEGENQMTTNQNNQDQKTSQDLLQKALFQAAKIGNIELMNEFIRTGANPFLRDASNRSALMYAMRSDTLNRATLLMELTKLVDTFKKRGRNE